MRRRVVHLYTGNRCSVRLIAGEFPRALLVEPYVFTADLNEQFAPLVKRARGVEFVEYRASLDLRAYPEWRSKFVSPTGDHMAKKASKTKARARMTSREERELRAERARLRRSVAHQRAVRQLSKRLIVETERAERALLDVAKMVIDRELKAEAREGVEAATTV